MTTGDITVLIGLGIIVLPVCVAGGIAALWKRHRCRKHERNRAELESLVAAAWREAMIERQRAFAEQALHQEAINALHRLYGQTTRPTRYQPNARQCGHHGNRRFRA